MSQKKVDQYKEYKKNKKQILKKEKQKKLAAKIAGWVVVIAVIGLVATAIGTSCYSRYRSYLASRPNYDRTGYVLGDLAGVLEEEAETTVAE